MASDPKPLTQLHAVRFADGTMYQCGFATPMEAESFRAKQFGHRAEGPIGEVIPAVMVPAEEHAAQLQLIRDLYAELQDISEPGHGGSTPFFYGNEDLENRIRKSIGLQELPPPPPPHQWTEDELKPGHFERVCEETLSPSIAAVGRGIDEALAHHFMDQQ